MVDVTALDQTFLLRVGLENTQRGVGVAEAGVERVVAGLAEIESAFNRNHPRIHRAEVLNLQVVLRGEAALEGVLAP